MAVVPDAGEPLSPQAADLVRRVARVFLDEPADLMAELHAAVSAAADEPLRSEPTLAAEVAASNRANVLHLAASMLKDPGGRVPANLTPEVLGIAREAFRRGIEQAVYTTYHAGQNAVWAYWMRTAFSLSQDPAVLRQALEAGSRSLSGFIDDMVAALSEQLRRERADLARSSHARRFEVVSLILDSAPITTGRASTQLGYDLRRRHTAAVLVDRPRPPGPGRARPGRRGPRPRDPRPAGADRDRQLLLGVGLARRRRRYRRRRRHRGDRGPPRGPGRGRARRRGGRRFPAQPLRRGRHPAADVPPAGPAGRQVRRRPAGHARPPGRTARPRVRRADARQLAGADRELRDTLCVYIGEQFSAARAARALYTHRNTVLNRLQRAERLLPFPLAGHGLEVGVALEIAQWLGTQPGSATHDG